MAKIEMAIKDYVVSLEHAKRMKKLGWKKETLFQWWENPKGRWVIQYYKISKGKILKAPIFAEIWEELPAYIEDIYTLKFRRLPRDEYGKINWLEYSNYKDEIYDDNSYFGNINPAEAAGEMWCWLVENKYLEVKNIGGKDG